MEVLLIEQTHKSADFANPSKKCWGAFDFTYAGFSLRSKRRAGYVGRTFCCMLGSYDKPGTQPILVMPLEIYFKFKKAVEAYNKKYENE
jgi:hypothetical protein